MTSRALVTPKLAARLVQLCGMFGSDHDGERANAAALADRLVRQVGLTWRDIIEVPAEWQHMARLCREHMHLLSDRERDFVGNLSRLRKPPSDKQLEWLTAIFERLRGEERAA